MDSIILIKNHKTAWKRSGSFSGYPSDSPLVYQPTVMRDIRCGIRELWHEFQDKGPESSFAALERKLAFLLFFPYIFTFAAYSIVFWARWEKFAWNWIRTVGASEIKLTGMATPPKCHKIYSAILGLLSGFLVFILFLTVISLIVALF